MKQISLLTNILVTAVLLALSTNLWSAELKGQLRGSLYPHSATYKANIKKGVSIKGQAVRSLKRLSNNQWLYSFKVDSFVADIDESVTFQTHSEKSSTIIRPHSYYYKLTPFFGSSKNSSVQFNWLERTASSSHKKNRWEIQNLPGHTYDKLSYQLQLLVDVDQEALPVTYHIAHKSRTKPSNFALIGKETLETKLGTTDAYLVKKIRAASKKRETHLWVSVEQPLLLLRMVQREKDGEEYEINIESAEVNGKSISFSELSNNTPAVHTSKTIKP